MFLTSRGNNATECSKDLWSVKSFARWLSFLSSLNRNFILLTKWQLQLQALSIDQNPLFGTDCDKRMNEIRSLFVITQEHLLAAYSYSSLLKRQPSVLSRFSHQNPLSMHRITAGIRKGVKYLMLSRCQFHLKLIFKNIIRHFHRDE